MSTIGTQNIQGPRGKPCRHPSTDSLRNGTSPHMLIPCSSGLERRAGLMPPHDSSRRCTLPRRFPEESSSAWRKPEDNHRPHKGIPRHSLAPSSNPHRQGKHPRSMHIYPCCTGRPPCMQLLHNPRIERSRRESRSCTCPGRTPIEEPRKGKRCLPHTSTGIRRPHSHTGRHSFVAWHILRRPCNHPPPLCTETESMNKSLGNWRLRNQYRQLQLLAASRRNTCL